MSKSLDKARKIIEGAAKRKNMTNEFYLVKKDNQYSTKHAPEISASI